MEQDRKLYRFASVIINQAVGKALDYFIPDEMQKTLAVGSLVEVPLRGRLVSGYVFSLKETVDFPKTSPLHKHLQQEITIPKDLLLLSQFMASYYCTPLSKIFKLLIPSYVQEKPQKKVTLIVKRAQSKEVLRQECIKKRAKSLKQASCLEKMLKVQGACLLSDLLTYTSCTKSVVDALVKQNLLKIEEVCQEDQELIGAHFFRTEEKTLTDEQDRALTSIKKDLDKESFSPHLIYGVTGSGKTEIYLQAIKYARLKGKSVLFLVPEVSLTPQTIARLKARFEEPITVIHYKLSKGEKYARFKEMTVGKAKIIVGVRSAIFSPIKDLGLIIIDEEHDSSYKQQEHMPCYHAKEMALMRAKYLNCTIILGSATPSLESYTQALNGNYKLHVLKNRAESAKMASITIVDMEAAHERASGFTAFSEELLEALKLRLKRGEQSLLFLNRRGYHTAFVCKLCGEALKCKNCAVSLTFHERVNELSCHLCSARHFAKTASCPHCKESSCFKYQGVGTELIEKSLHKLLPDVRTLRLDADTASKKGSLEEILHKFAAGKADVLIGTQMIAKGHHFPAVTLVGVLYLDSALQIPDFRAQENAFQLITQVAGRAGRSDLAGEVLLQTLMPTHPLVESIQKQDYDSFYQEEITSRKNYFYPPFSRIVKCLFSGANEKATEQFGQKVHAFLQKKLPSNFFLHPLAPAGYAKIRNCYRFQFFVRGANTKIVTELLSLFLKEEKTPTHLSFLIDVQPLSLF